jgi:hypothetical protein
MGHKGQIAARSESLRSCNRQVEAWLEGEDDLVKQNLCHRDLLKCVTAPRNELKTPAAPSFKENGISDHFQR